MNNKLAYSVGALMYSPALNKEIAKSVISGKFGKQYSLALCLEDTIPDNKVHAAEKQACETLKRLALTKESCYIPKIFIRVREPEQIKKLRWALGEGLNVLTGFIIPKLSLENVDAYIAQMIAVNKSLHSSNEYRNKTLYVMPILESDTLIDPQKRAATLLKLKEKLEKISDIVLNMRVGGNDFSQCFGVRRSAYNTIYDVKPIADILSDIITVFGDKYVVSGCVWEYFGGKNWSEGLTNEIQHDLLNGFVGKTIIHPKQIDVYNEAMKVSKADYEDAKSIVNWQDQRLLVSAGEKKIRMNEYNTHIKWANKIMALAEVYGVA